MGIFLAEGSNRRTSCLSHSNLPHASALRQKSRAPTFRSNVSSCSVIFWLSWKPPVSMETTHGSAVCCTMILFRFVHFSYCQYSSQLLHSAASCRHMLWTTSICNLLQASWLSGFCLLSYLLHRCWSVVYGGNGIRCSAKFRWVGRWKNHSAQL